MYCLYMKEDLAPAPTMFSLLHAAHAVETRVEEALEKVGLSGAKFLALTKLVEAGEPLPLGALAERLTCVRSNITQLVDRLEADSLVRRVGDPADRRSKRAEITALGRKRQAAGAKQVEALEARFTRMLSGIELTTLRAALAALR
jgi:MarR family transcriptional regulator, transcriptional regulator for hemolysin